MVDLDGPSGGGAIGEASDGGGAGGGSTGGGAVGAASGGGAGGGASGGETCSFFRKPSKSRNIRKRGAPASPTSSDDGPSLPSQKPKKTPNPDNKLHFSSARPAADSSSSNPDPTLFRFESSTEIQVHHDSRATATLETETDFSHDARALRERSLKQSAASLTANPTSTSADPKLYKGMNNYTDYKAGFRREQTVAGEKASGAHGPLRASAHIRMSARFDYQPDICKDYKETGYCGFGDACKFMHDRGDYKSGWQMDKEWEEKEKARKRKLAMKGGDDDEGGGGEEEEEDDEDEEGLPFACFICRQSFVDPVVTKCKHYFCEHCALKHHSKNKKCFVCNKPTLGIFNTAHEIKKRTAKEK